MDPWDLWKPEKGDVGKHEKKIKEAIKARLKDLIVEEDILQTDPKKIKRITIRMLSQYHFRRSGPGAKGIGHGPGDVGDALPIRDLPSTPSPGPAGHESGPEIYEAEVEVTMEEIEKAMFEDLGLPWLEEKDAKQRIEQVDISFDQRAKKSNPLSRLDIKRTVKEARKRQAGQKRQEIEDLEKKQVPADLIEDVKKRKTPLKFVTDDLIIKIPTEKIEYKSSAAVYLLMDRSGSMTREKIYIAKAFYFWMVFFLRKKYQTVEIVFIAHDVEAKVVDDEKEFFTFLGSGGTLFSPAYELAARHLRINHPKHSWNNYLFHFSDGENTNDDNPDSIRLIKEILTLTQMFGYGEIQYTDASSWYGSGRAPIYSTFYDALAKDDELKENERFMKAALTRKEEIYGALRTFLKKEMISNER